MESPTFVDQAECGHRAWPAEPRALSGIRTAVGDWLAPLHGLSHDDRDDVVLAMSEAASNCVEHAYPVPGPESTVEVSLWIEDQAILVAVLDHGRWRAPPAQAGARGRGISLMNQIMDSVVIHHGSRGTAVLMRRPLPSERSSSRVPRTREGS